MVMLLRLPQPGISFLCHIMYFDIITSGKINDWAEKNVEEKSNLKNEAR